MREKGNNFKLMEKLSKKNDKKHKSCRTYLCCCSIVIEFTQDRVFEKPCVNNDRLPNG